MNDRMARGIFPILRQGLIDRDRIATQRPPLLDKVQADLKQKLRFGDRPDGDYLGARYALACWLDEIFLAYDSPWSQRWNENKLETHFFQSNDRGWKFWDQAEKAEADSDKDTVEVYYLAMLLGFRGQVKDKTKLAEWGARFEDQIALDLPKPWPDLPDAGEDLPPGDSNRPMTREELRRLIRIFTMVICVLLGVAFFLLVSIGRIGGR